MNAIVCLASPQPSRACRAALRLACRLGDDVHVTALSAGHARDNPALEEAQRAGLKRVVHVLDPALSGADFFVLGMVLAEATRRLCADLVFTGMASDDEGRGLVPAALAHHWNAGILSGVEDAVHDRATANEIVAVCRAGGQRLRLAFKLPVVLAVLPEGVSLAGTQPAVSGAPTSVECLSLAQLGIDESRLAPRPDLLGSLETETSRPEVLDSVDALVARWLAKG